MPEERCQTLCKEMRISGHKLVETLFKRGGNRSMTYFPLRAVYLLVDRNEVPAKMLVSVPKRCFKRAVKRNRVKRQLREAYRKNKHLLTERMEALPDKALALAFIWMENRLRDSSEVESRMVSLLVRVSERL